MAATVPPLPRAEAAFPVSPDSVERLEDLAHKHGWTVDEAMGRALDLAEIVLEARDEDPQSRIYVYIRGKRYSLEIQK